MLRAALALFGTREGAGAVDNPTILAWAKECGIAGYVHDSIAWCALFASICAHRSGWALPPRPLWARDWALFGNPADKPSLGDVLVFVRDGGGHVGLYVGEDATAFHVLGGNQSDQVCITRILKTRLLAARRPAWKIAQPANVRPIRLAAGGALSTNEA